jgi:outer membrane protein assembly factor BamA
VSFTRRFDYPVPVSAAYRFEMSGVSAGELYFCVHYTICDLPTIEALREPHRLSPASLNLSGTTADDPLAPTSGWRARLDLEHASDLTFSDFAYHRVSGAGTRYLPMDVDRRRVVAGRLRLGWVDPISGPGQEAFERGDPDPDDLRPAMLHPRKRFYSGGARSVRGFAENQLGPRVLTIDPQEMLAHDEQCSLAVLASGGCDPDAVPGEEFVPRPIGGRSVVEGNLEYRFSLTRELQGAVFIDGAMVGAGLRRLWVEGVRAVTPGIGGRYRTPVGPIRVDLGYRTRTREELAVYTEFVDETGERRLVRLERMRDYDPLEGAGFLDQVLGRLTLHLSIGEAF